MKRRRYVNNEGKVVYNKYLQLLDVWYDLVSSGSDFLHSEQERQFYRNVRDYILKYS